MRIISLAAGILLAVLAVQGLSAAGESHKTAGGLTVYLGVLPAAMIQGEAREHILAAHGDIPSGRHAYHVMVALFDAASGERIEDASIITARVEPRRLVSATRRLEPMTIAGAITYGNYFTMADEDPHDITISVTRAGADEPVVVSFSYEHEIR